MRTIKPKNRLRLLLAQQQALDDLTALIKDFESSTSRQGWHWRIHDVDSLTVKPNLTPQVGVSLDDSQSAYTVQHTVPLYLPKNSMYAELCDMARQALCYRRELKNRREAKSRPT